MPINSSQTTRHLRGMGAALAYEANANNTATGNKRAGRGYGGMKFMRIRWTLTDNEAITPGVGGVPNGVMDMAWKPDSDNQNGNVFYDYPNNAGRVSSAGAYDGYLLVWYRGVGEMS